ncbi:MAG: hypothetical protein J6A79_00405 [Clostridia bacterium]|nr:hypothetical protein [Clostridia bacterium]
MGKVVDMIGKRCGRLTVYARGPDYTDPHSGYHRAQWWCECDCGNTVLVMGKNLRRGNTKSCGCYQREKCAEAGRSSKGFNSYEFFGDVAVGTTLQGDKFFIDAEDYEKVSQHYWYKHHQGYFVSNTDNGRIALHRFVLNAGPDDKVDHINHQKENACKANLRIVTTVQNCQNQALSKNNSSGCTGVNYNKRRSKWISRLMKNGFSYFLGAFDTFEEAVAARKAAEEKYFGEYSYDNSMAASPVIGAA